MITIYDLRIMNDTLINYYKDYEPQNEKKLLKHKIIQELLNNEKCFDKISKEDAIKILRDIGVSEPNVETTYEDITKLH